MKKTIAILSILASGALFTACQNTAETSASEAEIPSAQEQPAAGALDFKSLGGKWINIYVANLGDAKRPEGEQEDMAFIQFGEDGKVNGMSGNNLFFGKAMMSPDGKFTSGAIASTRRMGPFPEFESAFLKDLMSADKISVENGNLVLSKGGEKLLEFKPEAEGK